MNIIKEWIKNFKIHRIIANHANGNKETIWKSIKETTKMMLRR